MVILLFKNGKKYKMKEVSGERESWEGEQKKKERNSQVWIEKKQNKTHLFVSFNWIRITPEETDDLKYQKEKKENKWKINLRQITLSSGFKLTCIELS